VGENQDPFIQERKKRKRKKEKKKRKKAIVGAIFISTAPDAPVRVE